MKLYDDALSLVEAPYPALPYSQKFKVTIENKVVSCVQVIIIPDIYDRHRKLGYIHNVQTAKIHQGKGFTTHLLKEAITYCKQEGCYRIFLTCRDGLIKFYEHNGFKVRDDNVMEIRV